MTSTPTPPPNYSSVPVAPRHAENHNHNHHSTHKRPRDRWSSSSRHYSNSHSAPVAAAAVAEVGANGSGSAAAAAAGGRGNGRGRAAYSSTLLEGRQSRLAPEFSGRRSTRFAAKMHYGMPRVTPNKHAHSAAADEALSCLFKAGNNIAAIDNVLIAYEHKLWEVEDYIYMLKEFGNTRSLLHATKCFDFIMSKQNGRVDKGKLVSAMIGTLGRLGEINLALGLFERARIEGYGSTVYSFSAMISAFGRNGRFPDAVDLFRSMSSWGVVPNLITYNSIIDAGAKGEVSFDVVVKFYDEMIANGIMPDRLTYNSLLSVCASKGMWEMAQKLLSEMDHRRIVPDVFNYNTYLDTLCKAGQIDLARRVFEEMSSKRVWPNVVTFSVILNACSHCNSYEDASLLLDTLHLFDNQVYGVTNGLLMGQREQVWFSAETLFDEIMCMDPSTSSAFYNALTDMLWHFGQRRGAEMVVTEGRRRNVWKGEWSISCLDLHLMSCGAACAMVHSWLLSLHSSLFQGIQLPKFVYILTGWGKHSKVMGDGTLKKAVEALLNGMGSPFRIYENNLGRLVSPGEVLTAWLTQPGVFNLLVLYDVLNHSQAAAPSHVYPALQN